MSNSKKANEFSLVSLKPASLTPLQAARKSLKHRLDQEMGFLSACRTAAKAKKEFSEVLTVKLANKRNRENYRPDAVATFFSDPNQWSATLTPYQTDAEKQRKRWTPHQVLRVLERAAFGKVPKPRKKKAE